MARTGYALEAWVKTRLARMRVKRAHDAMTERHWDQLDGYQMVLEDVLAALRNEHPCEALPSPLRDWLTAQRPSAPGEPRRPA